MTASLCISANQRVRPDIRTLIEGALEASNSPAAASALRHLLENMDIAGAGAPLCQDCGYASVLVCAGQDTEFDGPLEAAVQEGVKLGYERGRLRQSVVKDALVDRTPEGQRPAQINFQLIPGDIFELAVMTKGGGSDNAGRLKMMRPTDGEDEIVRFAVETVKTTGPNSCPPLFLGIGIGGGFDTVAAMAKKALFRDMRRRSPDKTIARLEERIMAEANELGIGPAAMGGPATVLGVSAVTGPTHMACLPVAVNICCNQVRTAVGEL